MPVMNDVGVGDLRQYLSRYLERVDEGEAFQITYRGEPMALLIPLPESQTAYDRLALAARILAGPHVVPSADDNG
jgi:prevent-host-death family protein